MKWISGKYLEKITYKIYIVWFHSEFSYIFLHLRNIYDDYIIKQQPSRVNLDNLENNLDEWKVTFFLMTFCRPLAYILSSRCKNTKKLPIEIYVRKQLSDSVEYSWKSGIWDLCDREDGLSCWRSKVTIMSLGRVRKKRRVVPSG